MLTLTVTLLAGAVIGLSLGALGGGGSILTVPVLVYLLHEQPRVATTASLVIVGVTSILAATSHARSGRVRWKAAGVFGVLGIAASFGGARVNRLVAPNVLLLSFAVLMLVSMPSEEFSALGAGLGVLTAQGYKVTTTLSGRTYAEAHPGLV